MDIRALRYFVAVVDHQSFSRAAEALYVTQPTVSKMIQQLEQSLDLTLLERSGKRFTLTDAGNVVLQRGRALLAMHEEMGVELQDLQQLRRGDLRIGVTQQAHAPLAPLLAPITAAIHRSNSNCLKAARRISKQTCAAACWKWARCSTTPPIRRSGRVRLFPAGALAHLPAGAQGLRMAQPQARQAQ
jgi:DNA-binding MarR family transcriptional regulator